MNVTLRVTLSNFRTTLRRAQSSQRPPQPPSLAELGNILGIPSNGHLLRSVDGEKNLYLGIAGNSLVISSMRLLAELSRSECVFLDSTFFAVPCVVFPYPSPLALQPCRTEPACRSVAQEPSLCCRSLCGEDVPLCPGFVIFCE